ncbi:P-loop containing nucleoside triphosphate hydrolase protein [Hypoxylon crocopeplum]|nr:P-loop containing nucleoside triphosphate hydrolase protein [Hypoxylon crocopeplum]
MVYNTIMADILERLGSQLVRSQPDNKPIVVMTCGIAGAGKSTLSKAILAKYPNYERLSIDATNAAKHGIYEVDYPPEKYDEFQEEAAGECEARLVSLLREGNRDVVLDRSFYSKEDREYYKRIVESHGGRWVLVYLRAKSKDFLWNRIVQRRKEGINADSAYVITAEVLDGYWNGFEAPTNEGEIVIDVG